MNKREFIKRLRKELSGLPKKEVEERISFYGEMIDDRMEEGLSEKDAVAAVGNVEDIAAQITSESTFEGADYQITKGKRRLSGGDIALIALGFPIWFSLLVVAFSVAVSLYVGVWVVIVSLWATFVALLAGSVAGVVAGIVYAVVENSAAGLALIGAAILCAGLAIFAYFACKVATECVIRFTKKLLIAVKRKFSK